MEEKTLSFVGFQKTRDRIRVDGITFSYFSFSLICEGSNLLRNLKSLLWSVGGGLSKRLALLGVCSMPISFNAT